MKFYLFADDTNLLYSDKNLKSLESTVNDELCKLYDWLIANKEKESYQNFDRIDKIAIPLVNSNCVLNSVHYEDLSDFQSRGRCAKIKGTKDVDWEGMGQYSIFFSP